MIMKDKHDDFRILIIFHSVHILLQVFISIDMYTGSGFGIHIFTK